jgi:hypothetical protein
VSASPSRTHVHYRSALRSTCVPWPLTQLTQQDELIRDAADYAEFFAAASGMQATLEWLQ